MAEDQRDPLAGRRPLARSAEEAHEARRPAQRRAARPPRHGHAAGGGGHDILWGDWDPVANNTRQRDVLSGGAGNDWLYPSHGRSIVKGGAGADYVWAYYGKGTIDCGSGIDMARVRTNGAFRTRNCERIRHFCAHGESRDGHCLSPTGKPVRSARVRIAPHSSAGAIAAARVRKRRARAHRNMIRRAGGHL